MDTAALIDALRDPAAYRPAPAAVEVAQTHISVLFFAGDRVYKIKKPLTLDFLDYSTLDKRRCFCGEEVRLNRRLAPDVYLGVAAVVRNDDDSLSVLPAAESAAAEQASIVEYAVEMRRLPAQRMFAALLEAGEIDNAVIEAIADRVAEFHAACATGPGVAEYGAPENLRGEIESNFETLAGFTAAAGDPAGILTPAMHAMLRARLLAFLEDERALLEQRVLSDRIREGHGDLHAGNLCLLDEGIVAYDCIEFSPAFRCRDVACEIAFLAMDLDFRGFRAFASRLVRGYAARADDAGLAPLVPFYKTHLALVRAKVAGLRARGAESDRARRAEALVEARRYAQLAASYPLAPVLVLMCGLPGSGKSRAARAIGRPFEAYVPRSDAVRKHLAGLAPTRRAEGARGNELYSADMTRRTYDALRQRTAETLAKRRSVVVDATFREAAYRRGFFDLARDAGVPALIAFTDCPEELIRERLERRRHRPDEISDADWNVYLAMRDGFEYPQEEAAVTLSPTDDDSLPPQLVIDRLIGLQKR